VRSPSHQICKLQPRATELVIEPDTEVELIHWRSWPTKEAARSAIFEYLEAFYNRRRLHSALGYEGPVHYEEATMEGAVVA
jgi:transposase InsO family protein